MKEQSHKDEMSAALRGDFQRLRDRGVSATLVPHETAVHTAEPVSDDLAGRSDEPTAEAEPAAVAPPPVPEPQEPAGETPGHEQIPASDGAPGSSDPEGGEEPAPPRSGWLSRLVGR